MTPTPPLPAAERNALLLSVRFFLVSLARRHPPGRGQDADDLAQEFALAVLVRSGRYDPAYRPTTFARVVARTVRHQLREAADRHAPAGGPFGEYDPPGREPDPAAAAERAEALERVAAAMAELPPADRDLLTRRYWAEEPIERTALALGLGDGYDAYQDTRARIAAARDRMAGALAVRPAVDLLNGVP